MTFTATVLAQSLESFDPTMSVAQPPNSALPSPPPAAPDAPVYAYVRLRFEDNTFKDIRINRSELGDCPTGAKLVLTSALAP